MSCREGDHHCYWGSPWSVGTCKNSITESSGLDRGCNVPNFGSGYDCAGSGGFDEPCSVDYSGKRYTGTVKCFYEDGNFEKRCAYNSVVNLSSSGSPIYGSGEAGGGYDPSFSGTGAIPCIADCGGSCSIFNGHRYISGRCTGSFNNCTCVPI